MTRSADETIEVLNDLMETCRDGEAGFRMAAESVEDSEMSTLFDSYASQKPEGFRCRQSLAPLRWSAASSC